MKTIIAIAIAAASLAAGASIVGTTNDFIDSGWKARYGVVSCGPTTSVDFGGLDADRDGWSVLDEFLAMTSPVTGSTAFPTSGRVQEHPSPMLRLSVQGDVSADGVPLVVTARRVRDGSIAADSARWSLASGASRSVRIGLADRAASSEPYRTACYGARPGDVSLRVYAADGSAITNAVDVPHDMMSGRIGSFFRISYITGEAELDVPRMIRSLAIPRPPTHAEISWTDSGPGLYRGHAEMVLHAPDAGFILPGTNVVECWADIDRDGTYTPGEPYGCAVTTVGWACGSAEIGLTATHPSVPRINVAGAFEAGMFEAANQMTDRGVRGSYYPNTAPAFAGTNMPARSATRVRFVRTLYNDVVFDKTIDLDAHPTITEADVLAAGKSDLDWGSLRDAWIIAQAGNINTTVRTNASYRIVIGDGSVADDPGVLNNLLPIIFSNAFESGIRQTKAVPVAPAGEVYAGRPTFRWRHDALDAAGKRIKDYPAFQLRVWKDSAKSTPVYDSGVLAAPPRDADGVYSWTATSYAGFHISPGEDYFWTVSMLDAKFMLPNHDETAQKFHMSNILGGPGYGSIYVTSVYGGKKEGVVIACAYRDPDFSSVPDGMAVVGSGGDTCTIIGLPPGRYYALAFVDLDGDNVRGTGEPYGFAQGPDGRPVSVEVGPSDGQCSITIFDTPFQE